MAVCDICTAPGMGQVIGSEDMRRAVFRKGFNPFALQLNQNPMNVMFGAETAYEGWKNTIVDQDTSDWNICPECMKALKPYLDGQPSPSGVLESTVSSQPLVTAAVGRQAAQRYAPRKHWWQFWK